MKDTHEIYCSYLLRIWIEPVDGDQWRFSLEDTRSGERKGFASLERLCAYITRVTLQERCSLDNDDIPDQ